MADKEKQLKEIMRDVECTREEALEIWEMEQKAKKNGTMKINASSGKKRETADRKQKIDEQKVDLINRIFAGLKQNSVGIENLTIVNQQREITFTFDKADFSITLTKHRNKAGK